MNRRPQAIDDRREVLVAREALEGEPGTVDLVEPGERHEDVAVEDVLYLPGLLGVHAQGDELAEILFGIFL